MLTQTWPWWFSGIMIVLVMTGLLFLGKSFGVSATLRTACAAVGGGKRISFFNYNWKNSLWNIVFIIGAAIGGFIAAQWLTIPGEAVSISSSTLQDLQALGVDTNTGNYAPADVFSWGSLLTLKGFIVLVIGGFLVGFGARYAGGCTSGHAISGLSNLQLPSLIAVIGFFIGGLFMTHLLLPFIFAL
jgi:uncharacterized membrane protein YedE/YeeE